MRGNIRLMLTLMAGWLSVLHLGVAAGNTSHPAGSSSYVANITDAKVKYYFERPDQADGIRFGLKDSVGNSMDSLSVIQMTGQAYKYAGVYHTITNGNRTRVNLAVSNDLLNWQFRGMLVDHASMPRIGHVRGSSWITLTYERWTNLGGGVSGAPTYIGFSLFYNANDLFRRTTRATYTMPYHGPFTNRSQIRDRVNGTPSIYDMALKRYGAYYVVDGQYAFHIGQPTIGQMDTVGATTILQMFNPRGGTRAYSSTSSSYLNRFLAIGARGAVGQRDTLVTSSNRFNIQEYHTGSPGTDWDQWRVALFKFGDPHNYPTGNGQLTTISPKTPKGSTSFGNPSVAVVDRPSGTGKAIVISYFLFTEGAASGEGGPMIYYFEI